MSEKKIAGLPENAHRELKEWEIYEPLVQASDKRSEVTPWSVLLGLGMVVVFTATAVYIALRAGNGIEASIPIALLAIFLGKIKRVKASILENVMVQSIGQASGVVAAGATFVVPALYINQLDAAWWQVLLACVVGGVLGVVMIIPMRRFFVNKEHGKYPFPEGKAIAEVLVAGEKTGGGIGKILLLSFLMGATFDFLVEGVHLWNADLTSSVLPWGIGEQLHGLRIELQIAGIAALFGLGFLIGTKYAAIIASGSLLAFLVMVPLVYLFGSHMETFHYIGKDFNIGGMSPGQIFSVFVKPIGIGAIALSGVITIFRMRDKVIQGVTLGVRGLFKKKGGEEPAVERTDLDMAPRNVFLIQMLAVLAMGIVFFIVAMITPEKVDGELIYYTVQQSLLFALVGMVAGFLLSFLFTPVAAQAIAIMGVNPVSGMTLITVVLAIGMLILSGLTGRAGMVVALIVGTAVCTALSTSGAFISDLKVGYWIGSTPRNQQRWKFLGIVVAALIVAAVIPLMDMAYHFTIFDPSLGNAGEWISNDKVLPAPQANMIAAVVKGLMTDPANQPWLLYGLGGIMSVILVMAGVPALAFALGIYLPIGINLAVLAGAICGYLIKKTGKSKEIGEARGRQLDLIAAGLMAGAALLGITTATLRVPTLGAPIQYISVGMDYRMQAVVDGRIVEEDGLVVRSCDEVDLKGNQECNEQLLETPFVLDKKDEPLVDNGGKPILAHPWYEDVGRGVGFLMLILLGFGCYLLARFGAKWEKET